MTGVTSGVAVEIPSPLTPPDCDLRGLPWLPLNVTELRDGPLARMLDPEAFRAGILAMAAAWQQVPAASLPDDDATLAYLTGYGRDVATWQRARAAGALDEWVSCADGRLYHPTLAEKALDAWQARQRRQAAGAKGNTKRWGERSPTDRDEIAEGSHCDRIAIDERSPTDRRREREREKRRKKERVRFAHSPRAQASRTGSMRGGPPIPGRTPRAPPGGPTSPRCAKAPHQRCC